MATNAERHVGPSIGVAYIFFLGNYIAQYYSASFAAYLVSNILYLVIAVSFRLLGRLPDSLVLLALYPLCFHRYFADPYDIEFADFFGGPFKLVPLVFLLVALRPVALRPISILFASVVGVSSALAASWSRNFNHVLSDLIFYSLVLLFLSVDRRTVSSPLTGFDFQRALFYFYCLVSASYPVLWVQGIYVEFFGSIYFYWGHVYGFLMIFGILYFLTELSLKERLFFSLPVLINTLVFAQSLQSAHLIILVAMLMMFAYWHRRPSYLAFAAVIVGAASWLVTFLDPSTFLFLKLGQVVSLVQSAGIEDLIENNSVFIRLSQFLTIFSQNSVAEHLIGNGVGATYGDPLRLFAMADLHDRTYTEEELSSGVFFLVHEPIVKLYFNVGIAGIVLFGLYIFRELRGSTERDSLRILTIVCFALLWSASTQVAFLLLQIYIVQCAVSNAPKQVTPLPSRPDSSRIALQVRERST